MAHKKAFAVKRVRTLQYLNKLQNKNSLVALQEAPQATIQNKFKSIVASFALFALVASFAGIVIAANLSTSIQITTINGHSAPFNGFVCPANPLFNPITITGSGTGEAPPGQIEQYAVQIDWGDGTFSNDLGTFSPASGKGPFSFTFNGSHTYTTDGNYTIIALVHHSTSSGNDNPDAQTIPITICVEADPAATLTVQKQVVGGTLSASDFNIHVKSGTTDVLNSPATGSTSGRVYTLAAGTYSISEDSVAGYTASFSSDCSGGSVALASGASKTCVITNTFQTTPTPSHFLTVTTVGSGTVTSSPGTIDCGATCSDSYLEGTEVVLTAAPASGYTFDGFTGDCASTTATTCTVQMTAAKSVTATFTIIPTVPTFTLTATTTGSGAITSNVSGINCGVDCINTYSSGTPVTLTATADSGNTFGGWGGECASSGTSSTCSLTMNANKEVTATFTIVIVTPSRFTLTLTKNGDGNGTVDGSVNGATSTPLCTLDQCDTSKEQQAFTAVYDAGTVVTLVASPDSNSNFNGSWSGACSGTNTTCQITMSGNMSVNAHFALNATPPTGCTSNCGGGTTTTTTGGGGGGGGGVPVIPNTPTPQILGTSTPSIAYVPEGQVLGAATQLPRTGMPAFGLLVTAALGAAVAFARKK